jgi:hypothetical protein
MYFWGVHHEHCKQYNVTYQDLLIINNYFNNSGRQSNLTTENTTLVQVY